MEMEEGRERERVQWESQENVGRGEERREEEQTKKGEETKRRKCRKWWIKVGMSKYGGRIAEQSVEIRNKVREER